MRTCIKSYFFCLLLVIPTLIFALSPPITHFMDDALQYEKRACACKTDYCANNVAREIQKMRKSVPNLPLSLEARNQIEKAFIRGEMCSIKFMVNHLKLATSKAKSEIKKFKKKRALISKLPPSDQVMIQEVIVLFDKMCHCTNAKCVKKEKTTLNNIMRNAGMLSSDAKNIIRNESEIGMRCNANRFFATSITNFGRVMRDKKKRLRELSTNKALNN